MPQVSRAGDALVYSSWNENLHLVRLGAPGDCGHVPLPLAPDDIQFCIFRSVSSLQPSLSLTHNCCLQCGLQC